MSTGVYVRHSTAKRKTQMLALLEQAGVMGATLKDIADKLAWGAFITARTAKALKKSGRAVSAPDLEADGRKHRWYTPAHALAQESAGTFTPHRQAPLTRPAAPPKGTRSGVIAAPRTAPVFVPLDIARHLASLRPVGSYRRTA